MKVEDRRTLGILFGQKTTGEGVVVVVVVVVWEAGVDCRYAAWDLCSQAS